MTMRPPETSFKVASQAAVTVGSRVTGFVTQGPILMREVFAAIRAKIPTTSCHRTCESHSHR
jgi:hypothetical protein